MDFTEAQNDVVRAIAGSADVGAWERLLADVEILEHGDSYQIDYVCLAIVRNADGEFASAQFKLDESARNAIAALYRQRKNEAGDVIGGFELKVDQPGHFRFDYLNGAPKRINGVWDEERAHVLNNYLDVYKSELAAR